MSKKMISLDELSRYDSKIKTYVKESSSYGPIRLVTRFEYTFNDKLLDAEDTTTLNNLVSEIVEEAEPVTSIGLIVRDVKIIPSSSGKDYYIGKCAITYNNLKEILGVSVDLDIGFNTQVLSISFIKDSNSYNYSYYVIMKMYIYDSFGIAPYDEEASYSSGDYCYFPAGGLSKYDGSDWTDVTLVDYLRDTLNIPSTGVLESSNDDIDNLFTEESVSNE